MKIGIDAVLLGAWVECKAKKILDVGTGCGVISLILAQRYPFSDILAIDIDSPSIEEAQENFRNSRWSDRLKAELIEFPSHLNKNDKFDLIISNPPYFNSGIQNPSTPRERARHQDSLSVFTLLKNSRRYLNEDGILAMIYPTEYYDEVLITAKENGLYLKRVCHIGGHDNKPAKRIMSQFSFKEDVTTQSSQTLILYDEDNKPTFAYRELCKDLYLKF